MLATDGSTSEDERRTAAVELARMLRRSSFFARVKKLCALVEKMESLEKVRS